MQVTNRTELTIQDVKLTDGGTYMARVTSPGGTVSVEPKPVITLHPQSAAVQIGATHMLTVSASGNGTLAYQWFKDGQLIPGAQNIFLMVSIRSKNDLGSYTARVSNAAGFTESNPGIVSLAPDPTGSLTITVSGVGANLVGQGEPGTTYDVQLCSDLSSRNWITVQTVVADQTGRFEIRTPSSGRYWFIRTSRN